MTVQTVKTSAKGTFQSSKFKVTSTKLYRARVQQTTACLGAQSARELVAVVAAKKRVVRSGRGQ